MGSPRSIRIHSSDNVAIVANTGGLAKGSTFLTNDVSAGVELNEFVPQGHKFALRDIKAGEPIYRYNVSIGLAKKDLPKGSWINELVIDMPKAISMNDLPKATSSNPKLEPLEDYFFNGYRNPDGSVGTRNILAITTTVQCVSGVVDFAVQRIKSELLPLFPNVDDVIGIEHSYGCGVAIDAKNADVPIRTLRNIALNPNFGGEVMVVSLGCEKLQPQRLLPKGSIPISAEDHSVEADLDVVCLQSEHHVGFMSMIDSIMKQAKVHLSKLNSRVRVKIPASELVVGVQCGGSDAFSGVTANPVVGFATDLLIRAGATVMFSEVSEVRDGVDQLTARAQTPEIADEIIAQLNWYDDYLGKGNSDRSANTTPGNKAGGLSNIVEKAMGSIIKSGSYPINAVLAPGDKVKTKGLIFAATPASDFICGTLQLAAGMNMHVFTTGRGTPYGLAAVPVIKVATRTELANRWHDLMDLNAGEIADGTATIEKKGWDLFNLILEIASGNKKSWAEQWKLHNSLVLFNPAPVT